MATISDKNTPQSAKFKKAARELNADDSEEAFDHALRKVAKTPPPKPAKVKKSDR